MKRLIRLAAKLYPKPWRERYGAEFDALLDDAGAGGRIAVDVLRGAVSMQAQHWEKTAVGAALAMAIVATASWWAAQRPYITPGTHQVFRMDSVPGALLEFFVILALILTGVITLAARKGRWLLACIPGSYMASVVLVSLLTPEKIVSVGDSYCWDMWCVGVQTVETRPEGDQVLYTAEVSLFADSNNEQHVPPADVARRFFYVMDEQGRRFPILADSSFSNIGADATVRPGESVKSSLTFLAPATAGRLYLTGDIGGPPWVRLYFGSDLNPLHRRTLLRVA